MAMNRRKKRQKEILNLLFGNSTFEDAIAKVGVTEDEFRRWQKDENFIEEYEQRVAEKLRLSRITIATFQPLAAAKLIGLLDSEKESVARQACLDLLNMKVAGEKTEVREAAQKEMDELSDKAVAGIMRVLSEAKENKKDES